MLQQGGKVSAYARKGNYVLEKARKTDDSRRLVQRLFDDPSKVQMKELNDYLNSYSEKLALANYEIPSDIHIDKFNLNEIVKNANAG